MDKIMMPVDKIDVVYKICTDTLGVNLSTKCRKRIFVIPRWIFFGVLKELNLGYSLEQMGEKVGIINHVTVINGLGKFNRDILGNPIYARHYKECYDKCKVALRIEEKAKTVEKESTDVASPELDSLKNELNYLHNKLARFTKDDLMQDILKMDENQYGIFKERSKVMLKMIKSIRTYDNTTKKDFNLAS